MIQECKNSIAKQCFMDFCIVIMKVLNFTKMKQDIVIEFQ